MTKIIQLHPKSDSYQKLNKSMIKQLNQFEEKLMKGIVNLAMNGEWTKLNASTETGTIMLLLHRSHCRNHRSRRGRFESASRETHGDQDNTREK